jgi:hypothetical protein
MPIGSGELYKPVLLMFSSVDAVAAFTMVFAGATVIQGRMLRTRTVQQSGDPLSKNIRSIFE